MKTNHNKQHKATHNEPPSAPADEALEETCLYCGRVQWGNFQYLFKGRWRHEECVPGSEAWCEWYDKHPEKHTEEGQAIRAHSKQGKGVPHG